MVGGDELLGGDQRMEQRGMNGPKDCDALRCGEQAARPGDGLKGGPMKVTGAAITLPAPDRQQEINPRFIGQARELETVGPFGQPALRHKGGGARRGAIGTEQADLQGVGVVHGDAVAHRSVLHCQCCSLTLMQS
jgi:hypothetical protein